MATRPAPAFITGTSSEYLGLRPLRRLVRERPVVFVGGPAGAGKSAVAGRIAAQDDQPVMVVTAAELQEAIVARIREGHWSERLLTAPALVLDGPCLLRARKAAVTVLRDLLLARAQSRRRTVVCEVRQDGSLFKLMEGMPAGSAVTLALRLPASPAGRMRFARRACDQLGLPRSAAAGTDALEPWGYAAVIEELRVRKASSAAAIDVASRGPALARQRELVA